MAGRQPDFHVHAMDKRTDEKARVGAAWQNENGSISVVLNPFTVLASTPNLVITMFVNDRKKPDG